MTAINIVSAAVYLRGFSAREKVQTYALAAIFLVLLYNSPSGLVFYWILNNLFSLCKNLVNARCKNPRRFVHRVLSVLFVAVAVYIMITKREFSVFKRLLFLGVAVVVAAFPYLHVLLCSIKNTHMSMINPTKKGVASITKIAASMTNKRQKMHTGGSLFLLGALGLAVLLGLVLPASVISTSPSEFAFIGSVGNPLYYVFHSFAFYLGLCLVWAGVVYAMFGQSTKKFLQYAMPFLFVCALLNVYLFGTNYGLLDMFFKLDDPAVIKKVPFSQKVLPLLAACVVAGILFFIKKSGKGNKRLLSVIAILTISTVAFSVQKISVIKGDFAKLNAPHTGNESAIPSNEDAVASNDSAVATPLSANSSKSNNVLNNVSASTSNESAIPRNEDAIPRNEDAATVPLSANSSKSNIAARNDSSAPNELRKLTTIYHLSATGKNVLILFVDKAISSFFPYILRQFPEIAPSFNDFVYYPNIVSLACPTAKSTPSMLAGYEYTPEAMNARPNELLVDKHNEALLVLPKLFADAGYSATVTDPPFCNYEEHGDKTPFLPYPNIHCDFVERNYRNHYMAETQIGDWDASVSVAKNAISFALLEAVLPAFRNTLYVGGRYFNTSVGGIDLRAVAYFSHLHYLPQLTDLAATGNTYTFICNDLTHTPNLMKEPEYIPGANIDESKATCGFWEWKNGSNKGLGSDLLHYHVDASAFRQISFYLDAIKAMGIWDNTRIIICSDHGTGVPTPAFGSSSEGIAHAAFNPVLIVKDFAASHPLETDYTFMTLADIPFIAKEGLGISDENPFTHKKMSSFIKKDIVHCYGAEHRKDFNEVAVTTYLKKPKKRLWTLGGEHAEAFSVHDDIFKSENWTPLP